MLLYVIRRLLLLIPILLWRSLTIGHAEEEDEEIEG